MAKPMENWKERTELLLGGNAVEKLAHSVVLIAGVGGVGAYAAEMICRAGVGRITIVDADRGDGKGRTCGAKAQRHKPGA